MVRRALLIALLASASAAHAGDKPVYAPVPGWVKPAPAVDAAKLGAEAPIFLILDRQQRFQDGQVWSYQDTETRAASPEVLSQIGTITLTWAPDKGDLIIHRVEIIRGSEHIDLLKGGDPFTVLRREQQLEQFQLDGMLTATMPVSGLRVGDVLRLTYSTTEKDKALAGNVQDFAPLVADPFRVHFARERMLWPDGTDLHYKILGDKIAPAVTDSGGYHELVITEPVAKQPDMPDDAPARYKRGTAVEATTFKDWRAVSRAMAPLYDTDGTILPGSPLAAEVARIEAATPDPARRAMLALQLVQEKIRYLFKGMDNGNYVPQKPADTWQLRFGDCKAKSMLLLALLHAMKIDAEPVLASTQLGDAVPERLPMPGAFDHVFVHATIGDRSLWLDGTDSGAQLADIDDVPPFRNVLPLREAGADVMPLPVRASARPDVDVAISYDQSAGLSLPTLYTIKVTARGQVAEMARVAQGQLSKDQIDDLVRSIITPYVGEAVIASDAVSYNPADATATVSATGLVGTKWQREDQRYRADLDFFVKNLNFSPDRNRAAWQSIPVATGDPYHVHMTTVMKLPENGARFVVEGNKALDADLAGIHVNRRVDVDKAAITIDDDIASTGREIAVADLPKARSAVTLAQSRQLRITAPDDYPPHWKLAEEVVKDRRDGAFLAVYAKAIADATEDSDKALAYSNRAYFYAGMYQRRAAIADLDQAIKFQPDADTYNRRAGLRFEIGDKAGAIADYKAAQALNPSSAGAISGLATVEADSGAKDAALALVNERIDQGGKDKPEFLALKADILSRVGAKDEALATIDSAIAARPGNPGLLNDRCWLKGTLDVALDTALKDCTKSMELADSPAAALDSRAMVYFRMNRMADALTDLNAALEIDPGHAGSIYMRGVIRRRQGDAKQGDADLAAARLMSPQIDADYGRYGIKP